MTQTECTAKRWGSSLGIVIPRDIVEQEHIAENEKLTVDIRKKHLAAGFFGILSDWKRTSKDIKKIMDEGWE